MRIMFPFNGPDGGSDAIYLRWKSWAGDKVRWYGERQDNTTFKPSRTVSCKTAADMGKVWSIVTFIQQNILIEDDMRQK